LLLLLFLQAFLLHAWGYKSEGNVLGILLASTETTNNTTRIEPQNEQKGILKTQGFEVYYGIASLLAVFLYKRR